MTQVDCLIELIRRWLVVVKRLSTQIYFIPRFLEAVEQRSVIMHAEKVSSMFFFMSLIRYANRKCISNLMRKWVVR